MSAPENAGSFRNVTARDMDPAVDSRASLERYRIFRLCECPECDGRGRVGRDVSRISQSERCQCPECDGRSRRISQSERCPECRGEGRVRQEIATCPSPEALGVALVTLGREGEFEECPVGVLDSEGAVGEKWIIRPWLPSARNVSDAGRVLAQSKRGERA